MKALGTYLHLRIARLVIHASNLLLFLLISKEHSAGGTGKVYIVMNKETKEVFAIKSIRKSTIIEMGLKESILLEKKIMQLIVHPFIMRLISAFNNQARIYFLMPLFPASDLSLQLRMRHRFTDEKVVSFIILQIALALGQLHAVNLIFSDLKPANILVESDGYIKLADFGLSQYLEEGDKSKSFRGSYDYMAPEIIMKKGYTKAVDWWALGILVYELIIGIPPFYHVNLNQSVQRILNSNAKWPAKENPHYKVSPIAINFIERLLDKNPLTRLGASSTEEVLQHDFLTQYYDVSDVFKKEAPSPWKPHIFFQVNQEGLIDPQTVQESKVSIASMKFVMANHDLFDEFD
ncbi:hypothetical protein FGO68_gene4879 [Halteria grandinella]|uniref:Protein kinase domain-containing protein n=1 Tax=Halteria grandinella TaxID=5974 RepID=A0A8J8NY95_HALGN|nr:hypothetical protein FGO68_gene4879 [Halteria grandinella]